MVLTSMNLVLIVLTLCAAIQNVWGLQCYQCTNMDARTDNSVVQDMFSGKLDPHCENPILYGDTNQVECPAGFRCGSLKTITTAHIPLVGDITINTLSRDCMPAEFDGCDDESSKLIKIMGGLLSFVAAIGSLEVEGGVCYCSTDNCLATWCQSGEVEIVGSCVAWYFIAAGVAGSVVFLLLITCCCCCCCRCCRSKPRPVFTTISVPPNVTVISSPLSNGTGGYTRFQNEVEMQPEC